MQSNFSFFRSICLVGAMFVVYFNAKQLNDGSYKFLRSMDRNPRVQTSTTSSISAASVHVTPGVYGRQLEDDKVAMPTNHHSLPPIYWINLDISTSRRQAMREMFLSLGITDNVRVSAFDINATLDLWNDDRLIFHPSITMEERDGRPSNKKHIENIYEYQEAACLMSHLKAIKQAYRDGHAQVLVVEDDAQLSHTFRNQWKPYVDQAPLDWKILQFATNNANVVRQGVNLVDPFITWQPYHWSTRAYLINRAGMQTIMDKFYSKSPTGQDIWRIDEAPMVVADEVLYYMTGDAYTSTGLWVDSQNFGSTIQSNNAHSNLTALIGEQGPDLAHRTHYMLSKRTDPRPESLLVLMSVVAKDLESLTKELQWIRQDNQVLGLHHLNCHWEINLALANMELMEVFEQATLSMAPNIHFHAHVTDQPFNKFSYVRNFVEEMADYDLILFKDNDQRISGFPWRTFVEQKADAIVSGPLRQNAEEALLWRHTFEKRQYFQFHAAEAWTEDWNTKWSSKLFAEVIPTEVPLLEMYFVLFDAKFASYFFDLILTPEFINQTSAWGPDLLWCPAAMAYDKRRPSCHLVPLVSSHEDTQQIFKNATTHKEMGNKMVDTFKENRTFEEWMRVPEKWRLVIGGQLLWQIERRCRKLLKLRLVYPFDLAACPRKVKELVEKHHDIDPEEKARATTNADGTLLLNPSLTSRLRSTFANKIDVSRTQAQNRARVNELVQAVKANRATTTSDSEPLPTTFSESQRKSLDAFQVRLDELRRARAEAAAAAAAAEEETTTSTDATSTTTTEQVAVEEQR